MIPMSEVIFDENNPPENNHEKTIEFLSQAIIKLYYEWRISGSAHDKNLILRLSDNANIRPEWFVQAEELQL